MKIITVIPLQKGPFKENLTYFSSKNIAIGSVVSIPFRNKKILGLTTACQDVTEIKSDIKGMSFNLKKINEIKEHSIFRDEFIEAVLQTGKYFVASNNNSIASLIPSVFIENYDQIIKFCTENKSLEKNKKGTENLITEKLLFQARLEDRLTYYKTLVRSSFASKKSVFIVLPTENDIENFYLALSKGIENFTFFIHSGLSNKKTIEKLKQIITATHPVLVLGTAPYLSIPRNDFDIIILEHENSRIYKAMARPYFDLRLFVELFAIKTRAKLILADSLLRFETIERKEQEGLGEVHPLSFRINFDGEIEILGKETSNNGTPDVVKKEKFRILTDKNITEIRAMLLKKNNVFIFALRKGLATITLCKDCGEPVLCPNCSAPVVLYLSRDGKKRMFACNKCKEEIDGDTKCASCGSWNLMPLGIGTDTVYEEIKNLFPETKIFKLDKDSVKTKNEAKKIIGEFESDKGSILVATELGLFYLKEKVPLSIIASFDSLWSIPNFQMNEKIIQLVLDILQKTKDKLIIQTKNEKDEALLAIKNENLLSFVREELSDRRKLDYPPFRRFIKITHLGTKEDALWAKKILAENFKDYNPEIFSGFTAKLKGKYVTNALLKIELENWSLPILYSKGEIDQNLWERLVSLPIPFEVFVDPEDLL